MQFDFFQTDQAPGTAYSPTGAEPPYLQTAPTEVVCWSKMQAEAGQPLSAILYRKELERAAGGGWFYWGIGNSLGAKVGALCDKPIKMIFSKMLSKPKAEDTAPEAVFAWTAFVDRDGCERPLPDHVLVTSRAQTASGVKSHHYALVCHSNQPLTISGGRPFNPDSYKNFGGNKLGHSQVTALLEPTGCNADAPGRYAVDIEVCLQAPYCIRLVRPILMSQRAREEIVAFGTNGATPSDWHLFAKELRRSYDKTVAVMYPRRQLAAV